MLDWRKPDSVYYAMRVVFDNERGGRVYITGDIGEAVVYPTCAATLRNMALCFTSRDKNGDLEINEGYFMEKIKASNERYCRDRETFVEDFKKEVSRRFQFGAPLDFDVDTFLRDHMGYENGGFMSPFRGEDGIEIDGNGRISISDDVRDELNNLDTDYSEWFFDCGKRLNPRIALWLVGMRLAHEQVESMINAPKE